jgi:hypothetical protein
MSFLWHAGAAKWRNFLVSPAPVPLSTPAKNFEKKLAGLEFRFDVIAELKECACAIGLDGDRLAALEAQLAAKEGQTEALRKYEQILTQLVSGSTGGANNNYVKPLRPGTRNPFVMLLRWWQKEPGFEDTVAKYASLLPILETTGRNYSKTALIGIIALQARQLEIARTVHIDVRFQTIPSAALDPVTKGIMSIASILVIISVIVAGVLYGIVLSNNIPVNTDLLNKNVSQDMIHSIVAFLRNYPPPNLER